MMEFFNQTLTTTSWYEFEHPSNYMLVAITGVIGTAGIPGNLLLIFLISRKFKTRKPFEWLIFNLALIDTFMCLNNAILETGFILNYKSIACKIGGFVEYLFGCMSFTVPPTVAYNRYLSMYNMALYKTIFIPRNVVIICLFTWLINFGFFCPALITGNLGLDELGICGVRTPTTLLQVVMFLDGMFISLSYVISFCCGYKIIKKLRDHKAGLASDIQSSIVRESREMVTLFSLLLAIPLFWQMPSVCVKVIQMFIRVDPWISRTFVSTFSLTSACNPYLTLWVVKDYRKRIKNIVSSKPAVIWSIQNGSNF